VRTTFDMSAAWSEATAMIRTNREVLLIIAGIFFFLPSVAVGFAVPGVDAVFDSPEAMQAQMLAFYSDYGWVFVLVALVQIVGSLALLALLRDRSRPTVGQAIRTGMRGLLPAIGVSLSLIVGSIALLTVVLLITATVPLLGSTLLLVLLGVIGWVFIRMSLSSPIIAIDKLNNPIQVLRRSWQMTRGHALRLFAFYVLLGLVYLVISLVIGMIVGALVAVLGEDAGLIVSSVISGLLGAIASVIFVGVIAAVHRQLSSPWGSPAGQDEMAG
jgi:hypothetical protein